MIIDSVATLALFCLRCGNIQLHYISRFSSQGAGHRLICSCGQVQATVASAGRRQYILDIPCGICETSHLICFDSKLFWQSKVSKIYCHKANLELGFVGSREVIESTLATHSQAAAKLVHDVDDLFDGCDCNSVKNSQIMLQVLNKIHDIAEQGGVCCCCGSTNITATLLVDAIELNCNHCDGRLIIPARNDNDLSQAEALFSIELVPQRAQLRRQE
ncbi:MAG TPA: hypothetical protein PKA28_15170 [Methylomusa anaerophila]|uniref:Uncharacterized protein n=1 Tax=Methylomusa anaerophila TaxID=1930071 RepID=A0A348AJH5_9FIRM|nr:hypothetical protein [Methylomusa anaerophila]BBB91223.1 hypothetical protein MAMMFC1_01894 [Methylomusa anaerophila]HML89782.1 hypothetical protein [Methylomusa anaerophila]